MKVAAVSQLKASLSGYLASVKAGDEVLVVERGKPVARIVPVMPAGDEEGLRLQALERHGVLRRGTDQLPKGFWDAPRPLDRKGLARRTLLSDRREGR